MERDLERILFDYYEQTFLRHLGVQLPFRAWNLRQFESFWELLEARFSQQDAAAVANRIVQYRTDAAPAIKMEPLVRYLNKHSIQPAEVLDFGSGDGMGLRMLTTCFETINVAVGVETDIDVITIATYATKQLHKSIRVVPSLNVLEREEICFDLVTAVHTLHHLNYEAHDLILKSVFNLLDDGGIFYLYEDTWNSSVVEKNTQHSHVDKSFLELPSNQKQELFVLNEFWANSWFYERHLEVNVQSYRTLEEWGVLFTRNGFTIIDQGTCLFDARRLHGVPAGWILARKA